MPNNNLDGSRNSPNTLRPVILLPLYVIGYCAATFVLPVDVRHGYGGHIGGLLLLLMLAIIFRLFKKYALTSQQRTAELSELDWELQKHAVSSPVMRDGPYSIIMIFTLMARSAAVKKFHYDPDLSFIWMAGVFGFLLVLYAKNVLTSQHGIAKPSELDRELQERADLELRLKQLTLNTSGYGSPMNS